MTKEYQYPLPPHTTWGKFRDEVAFRISDFALTHVATPWYGAMIGGAVRLGLDAAIDGARQERTVPTSELIPVNPEPYTSRGGRVPTQEERDEVRKFLKEKETE